MAAYNPKQHVDARDAMDAECDAQLRRAAASAAQILRDAIAASKQRRERFFTERPEPTPSRRDVDDHVEPRLVNIAPRPVCRPRTSTPNSPRVHRPAAAKDPTDKDREILRLALEMCDKHKEQMLAESRSPSSDARRRAFSNKVQSQATASTAIGGKQAKTGEISENRNRLKEHYNEICRRAQENGLTTKDIQRMRAIRKALEKPRLQPTATQTVDGKQAKTGEISEYRNRLKEHYDEICRQAQGKRRSTGEMEQIYFAERAKYFAKPRLQPTATQRVAGKETKTSTSTETSDNLNFIAHFVEHENRNIARELARPKETAHVAATRTRSRHSAPSGPRDVTLTVEEVARLHANRPSMCYAPFKF